MRIVFSDGSQKGIADSSIANMEIQHPLIKLEMNDGAVFVFPACNVREIHYGGSRREQEIIRGE
jgi:hypothetical protein